MERERNQSILLTKSCNANVIILSDLSSYRQGNACHSVIFFRYHPDAILLHTFNTLDGDGAKYLDHPWLIQNLQFVDVNCIEQIR